MPKPSARKTSQKNSGVKYKVLEEIAIADVAFEAYGKSLGELFENAALATEEVMVDIKGVKAKEERKIKLASERLEDLLYDFLSELVYYKDADALLFSKYSVNVEKKGDKFHLTATLGGEKLDQKKHSLKADVKAVTWHMFEIKETPKGWQCRVILDI